MSRLRLLVLAAVLALSGTSLPPAAAQPADGSARALALGHEAIGLYNKGNWADARAKFEEAERLAHSPVFMLYLARCARNAGDLAAASATYRRLVSETVPPDAPAPWAAAVESAKQELPEVDRRIAAAASASASASAAPPSSASALPTASASAPAPTGSATGTTAPTGSATGTTAPPGTSPSPSASAASAPIGREPGPLYPGVVALGVGAVGVGAGIGLFAHALSIASGINARCPDRCPEELPNRNTAVAFADGATAAFVLGGAALAAGLVLVLVRPGGKPAAQGSLSVQPGVGSLRISGSF